MGAFVTSSLILKPVLFFFFLLARAGVWLLFIDLLALMSSLLTLSVSWRGPYTDKEKFLSFVTGQEIV